MHCYKRINKSLDMHGVIEFMEIMIESLTRHQYMLKMIKILRTQLNLWLAVSLH